MMVESMKKTGFKQTDVGVIGRFISLYLLLT